MLRRTEGRGCVVTFLLENHARTGGLLCADPDGDGCCDVCGVELVTDCPCGGVGYHLDGCADSEVPSPFRVYTALPLGKHSPRGQNRPAYASTLEAHVEADEALFALRGERP